MTWSNPCCKTCGVKFPQPSNMNMYMGVIFLFWNLLVKCFQKSTPLHSLCQSSVWGKRQGVKISRSLTNKHWSHFLFFPTRLAWRKHSVKEKFLVLLTCMIYIYYFGHSGYNDKLHPAGRPLLEKFWGEWNRSNKKQVYFHSRKFSFARFLVLYLVGNLDSII